jgi:hypothetical protein
VRCGYSVAFGNDCGEKTALLRYSEYERASVYAMALLHEMGHLRDGDSGSYTEPASITSADVTTGFDHSTNKEINADRFAVQQLRQALDADDWRSSPTGYPGRSNIANHVLNVLNVAVNTYDYRVDPWGALNGRRDLSSFSMRGYSHLNLQLRLLIMVYQLVPDPAKRAQLSQLLQGALDRTFSPLPRN